MGGGTIRRPARGVNDGYGTIRAMRALFLATIVTLVTLGGCGGHPPIPMRGVVEADVGSWKFRRFQPVLDVEVWVENNKAEAYTGSYVAEDALKSGHVGDA